MDEPLSNLDAKLRVQMRAEIAELQRQLGTTTIYVTHDQVEAMTMGHRVAVMSNGVLQQVDAPEQLFDRPKNLFVAGFIGTPPMSLLEASVTVGGEVVVSVGGQPIPLGDVALASYPRVKGYDGRGVVVGIRAGSLRPPGDNGFPTMSARVDRVEFLGEESIVYFDVAARSVSAENGGNGRAPAETEDGGRSPAGVVAPNLVGSFPPGVRLELGTAIPVGVDTAALHFFDPETGAPLS
jgi:multiple sugar transport system ATP-binding protein